MITLTLLNRLTHAGLAIGTTVLVKGSVILLITGILLLLQQRVSAARRCAIGNAGLSALLVIPLLIMVLPSWQVGHHRLLGSPEIVPGSAPAATADWSATDTVVSGDARIPSAGTASPSAWFTTGDMLASFGFLLWFSGLVVLLLRLRRHYHFARRIVRRGTVCTDEDVCEVRDHLAAAHHRLERVRILISPELGIPFSCGIVRPVVVLPAESTSWDRAQKKSVLLHEFAHLRRRDHLFHFLSEIARAFYWFNPLVWFVAGRTAIDRERACDDFALCNGTSSADYAGHLLSIARTQLGLTVPVGSAGMAGRFGLGERIEGILDGSINRTPVQRERLFPAAALALILLVPFATIDSSPGARSVPTTAQLARDLRVHPDPLMRRQAAWWLGEHEDRAGVAALIESLADDSAGVRAVAAWALGEIKDGRAIEPLATATRDSDPLVREMAILALGEIEDPAAFRPLQRFCREKTDEHLNAVIWALGEIGTDDSREVRTLLLRQTGQPARENQEVWVGEISDHLVIEAGLLPARLASLLNDLHASEPRTRRLTAFKLGIYGVLGLPRITGAVNPLLDTLDDPDPGVRAMAVWALDEINPSRRSD